MDRKLAEQIVALVDGCIDQLISSLAPVEKAASAADFAAYKRGVARVITAFDVEIVDRLAGEHPGLRPDEDDDHAADDLESDETPPPRSSRN